MKVSPAFFQDEETRRLLEMAAAAAALPMCLHSGDGLKIWGWGGCEACAWINGHGTGKRACRKCRSDAARLTLLEHVPVTFVCHMGFTCVIAAPFNEGGYTVVFGPFIPADAAQGVEFAVRQGLLSLDTSRPAAHPLPFSIKDVRVVPQGSVSAAADWLLYGLRSRVEAWVEKEAFETPSISELPEEPVAPNTGNDTRPDNDVGLRILGLSLLCGHPGEVRSCLADMLAESNATLPAMQSQMTRALSEMLDTVQRLGGDTTGAWKAYSRFVEKAPSLESPEMLLRAADRILRGLSRDCAPFFNTRHTYMPLVMASLHRDYASDKLLSRIAREAGVAPSSITRALEKMTGASFSEVLGRIRIHRACRLLRTTAMPTAGIGVLVGISDQSNFCKVFRRYRGCSPGIYREQLEKRGRG